MNVFIFRFVITVYIYLFVVVIVDQIGMDAVSERETERKTVCHKRQIRSGLLNPGASARVCTCIFSHLSVYFRVYIWIRVWYKNCAIYVVLRQKNGGKTAESNLLRLRRRVRQRSGLPVNVHFTRLSKSRYIVRRLFQHSTNLPYIRRPSPLPPKLYTLL